MATSTTLPAVNPTNPGSSTPASSPYPTATLPKATTPPVTPTAPTAPTTLITPTNQNNGSTLPTPAQSAANSNPQGTTVSTPSPQYTDSSGNPFYYQNGQVVYGTVPSTGTTATTGTTTTGTGNATGTQTTGNPDVDALAKAQNDLATEAKTVSDTIAGITNGTLPLSAGDQAQIEGLQQQFEQLIQKQTLVNTSDTNTAWTRGYTSGAAEYNPTFQVSTIGDVIGAGATQIANLQTQEASAIATLTQSLKDNDIKGINEAFTAYQTANTATQDAIKTVIADTQSAMNDAHIQAVLASGVTNPSDVLAALQKQGYTDISSSDIAATIKNLSPDAQDILAIGKTAAANGAPPDIVSKIMASPDSASALTASGIYNSTLIPDLQKQAKANGAPQSVIDAIGKATDTTSAFTAAGDYLQTATGDVALYLQYKRDAEANSQVPQDFQTWDANYQKQQDAEKISTAYGTAFATESGKAAADAKYTGAETTSPVVASTGAASGITFNAPASIAPYVAFSANGVKYVDLSSFAGTPTEKNQAVQTAQAAGYKVITNKNTALDVQNITDATQKLNDMKAAFDGVSQDSAAVRDSYGAALTWAATQLQTNPDVVGTNVYQDAALDVLKAMSGVQGFRGGASMVHTVQTTFPQTTNTNAVNDKLISNLQQLIGDRETALVGKPSASDQALIDANNAGTTVENGLKNIKMTNPTLYNAASSMYTSINPDTNQPYTAADILQAFPELNQ